MPVGSYNQPQIHAKCHAQKSKRWIVISFVCLFAYSFNETIRFRIQEGKYNFNEITFCIECCDAYARALVLLPILTSKPLKSWSNVWLDYIINITKCTWAACIFAKYTQTNQTSSKWTVPATSFSATRRKKRTATQPFFGRNFAAFNQHKNFCAKETMCKHWKSRFQQWVWVFAAKMYWM